MNSDTGSRRRFHVSAIYGMWAAIAGAVGLPAFAYLLFPSAGRDEEWVDVGDVSTVALGVPEERSFLRQRRDGWRLVSEKTTAWVVRVSEEDVVALAPRCPHLGCAYRWDDRAENFLCPCHDSSFAPDGEVLSGPASRPLDRYASRLEDDRLLVAGIVPAEES